MTTKTNHLQRYWAEVKSGLREPPPKPKHTGVRKIISRDPLDGSFGAPLRNRRIIVTFIPGDGSTVRDRLELRPKGTRKAESVAVIDVYRFAMRARVQSVQLSKARERREKLKWLRAARRLKAAEKRLTRP
jgi:hypothetical protein